MAAAAVCVLSACGAADSRDSTRQVAPGNNAAAVADCDQLVDGTTYTRVLDASSTTGVDVGSWLRTRSTTGAWVPDLGKRYAETSSITVCLMDAPGIAIPSPPKSGQADEPGAGQYAIVLVGIGEKPALDSVGPAEQVQALFDKVAHPGENPR